MDRGRLRTQQHSVDGAVVVTVTGEIDMSTTAVLADALARAADDAVVVVTDLTAVTFLDSTGINPLLRTHHDLAPRGGRLALAGVQPPVLRVLELTGVNTAIPLYPTVAHALHP